MSKLCKYIKRKLKLFDFYLFPGTTNTRSENAGQALSAVMREYYLPFMTEQVCSGPVGLLSGKSLFGLDEIRTPIIYEGLNDNNGLPVEEFDQDDEVWQRLKDRRYSRLNMSRPEPLKTLPFLTDYLMIGFPLNIGYMYSNTFRPPNPIFELLKNFTHDELLELSQYDDRIPVEVVLPKIKLEGLE